MLDDASLLETVEWSPALRRPTVLLQWGFGAELNGFPTTGTGNIRPPNAPIERDAAAELQLSQQLKTLTAETGVWLAQGLYNRVASQSFGDWGQDARGSSEHPGIALLEFAPIDGLIAQSRAQSADVLMALSLTYRTDSGRPNTTIVVLLYDVESGEKLWESKPLSKSKIYSGRLQGKDFALELASSVLEYIDSEIVLRSMPELSAQDVERRLAAISSNKQMDPLAALVELRYFELAGLTTPGKVEPGLAKIVGRDNVARLKSDDELERRAAVDRFLPANR